MLNVAVVAPALTVTDPGAANTGEALLVRVTTVPPGRPGWERLTEQVVL